MNKWKNRRNDCRKEHRVWTILEAVAVTNFLHPNAVGAAFLRAGQTVR
jgi:hypothetical protein